MNGHSFYGNPNEPDVSNHHPKSANNVFCSNIISRQEFNKDFMRSRNFLEEQNFNGCSNGLSKVGSANNGMVYVNSHGELVHLDYNGHAAPRGMKGQLYSGHVGGHPSGNFSSQVSGNLSSHLSSQASGHFSRPSLNGSNVFKKVLPNQAEYIHGDFLGEKKKIYHSQSLGNNAPMMEAPTSKCNVNANEIMNKRLFINNLIEIKEKLNNIKRERMDYEKEDEEKEEEENANYMVHLKSYDKLKNSYSLTNVNKVQEKIMNKVKAQEEKKKMSYSTFFEDCGGDVNYPGGQINGQINGHISGHPSSHPSSRICNPSQQNEQYAKFEKRKSAEQMDEESNYVFYDLKQYLGENHRQKKGYFGMNGVYGEKQGEMSLDHPSGRPSDRAVERAGGRLAEQLNDPLQDRKYDSYLDRKCNNLHDRHFEKFLVRKEDQEKAKNDQKEKQSKYEHLQKIGTAVGGASDHMMRMVLEQESLYNNMQKHAGPSKALYTNSVKGLKVVDNVMCCLPPEDTNHKGKKNIPTMMYLGGSVSPPGVGGIGGVDPCGKVFNESNVYDVPTSLYLSKGLRDEDNLKRMLNASTKKVLNYEEDYRMHPSEGYQLYKSKKNGGGAGCIENGAGAQMGTTSTPLRNENENYVGKSCSCTNYGKKKGAMTDAVSRGNCSGDHLKKVVGRIEKNGNLAEQVKGSGAGGSMDMRMENNKGEKNVCRKNSGASMSNNINLNVSDTDLNGNKNSSEKRNSYDNNNGMISNNSINNVDNTVAYFKENCLSNENVVYDEEKKIFKTKENCNIKIYRRSLEKEKMLNFPLIHLGENDVIVKRIKLYYPIRNENIFTNISKIIFMTSTNICSLYLSDSYLIHYDDVKIQSYLSKGGFGVVYKGILLRKLKKCEIMYGASGKYSKALSNQNSLKGLGGASGETAGRTQGGRSSHRQLNGEDNDQDNDEDEAYEQEQQQMEQQLDERRNVLHADGGNQDGSSNYADNSNVQDGAESKGNSGHASGPNRSTPNSNSPKGDFPNKHFPMKKKKSHNSDNSKLSRSTKKLCNLRNQLIEKIFDTFKNPVNPNGGGSGMNGGYPLRGAEREEEAREVQPEEEEDEQPYDDDERKKNCDIEDILKSWDDDKANQEVKKKAINHDNYNMSKGNERMLLRNGEKFGIGNVNPGEDVEDAEFGSDGEKNPEQKQMDKEEAMEKMDLKKGSNCIHVQEIRKLKKKMLNFIYSKKTNEKIIIDRDEFFIEAKRIFYKLKMMNNTELDKKYHEEIIAYLLLDVYHNNTAYKNSLCFLYVKGKNIITYGMNKESLYIFDNKNIFHYYSDKCIFKIVFIDEHKELKKYQNLTVFNVLNNERMMKTSSLLKHEINKHKNGLNKLAIIPFSKMNMSHLLNALIFGFLKFLFNLRKKYHKQPNNCSCYPQGEDLQSTPNGKSLKKMMEREQDNNQTNMSNNNAFFSNLQYTNSDACGDGAFNFNKEDRDSIILQEKINMLDEFLCCNYEEVSADYAGGKSKIMGGSGSGNNDRSDETENNNGVGTGSGSGVTAHGSSGRSNNVHRDEADKMGSTSKANLHLSNNGAGSSTVLNTNNTDESKTTMMMNVSRKKNAFKDYGNEREYNYSGKVSNREEAQQHLEDVCAENCGRDEGENDGDQDDNDDGSDDDGSDDDGSDDDGSDDDDDDGDADEERAFLSLSRAGRKVKGTGEKGLLPEVKNVGRMGVVKSSKCRVDTKGIKNAKVTSLSVEGKNLLKMKSGADGKGVKNMAFEVKEEAAEGRNLINDSEKVGDEKTCEQSEELVQVKTPVAIKIHDLKDSKNLKNFLREIEIYKNIQRPNICTFYGICIRSNKLMLLLEYYPKGNLFNFLKNKNKIHKKQRLAWASEMCSIVHAFHTHNPPVINGDIKTSNVLIDNNMHLVMCDFGKARFKNTKLYSNFGSYRYMAPETFSCTSEVTEKIDIWSLACCIVEIFSSKYPYHNLSKNIKIRHELLVNKKTPHIPNFLPNSMKKCLQRCFSFNPEERPCAYEMYKCLKKIKVVE
ncbi:tyrosine kinase-like protein, putative [Plasmodium knowlesi strain H]|uniref:Tyrosine kinase-like protein, putative n=3 Tax=Plasmodium knowlesi TaxID=5850 RepID=A0A5K1VRL3_PLAKH|nr:tyrosine kinase-like protein, putative [Plasmodium knowlesi strain H]OTN64696.1 putative Protein kinase [Plasmodium knowlesi]CAA9989092.1 tyrosine kinase-like protein, putative [Plasmodium knowlesi strain H]SBO27307.1 tyrosine kinase-like protein, putative [Plasmodium knowlesi strain H]SBO28932.1 tyrosine kinase-like protein, putative [Plasmodium knowlesi strain H]VVS78566.1 tyrosine kinase-like protein, putative [Plasmodium knowlesi strain H]|eukprot:XP_002261439.1 protein kinase, putative [Plasmodium knowlesi strain H]